MPVPRLCTRNPTQLRMLKNTSVVHAEDDDDDDDDVHADDDDDDDDDGDGDGDDDGDELQTTKYEQTNSLSPRTYSGV